MPNSRSLLLTTVALLCASAPVFAGNHEDLAFMVGEHNHDKHSERVVQKLFTFKLGDKCWAKVLDKSKQANRLISAYARGVQKYAKVVTDDDWYAIEGSSANNKETNQALVLKMVDDFAPKFHITLNLEGDDCEPGGNGLWLKYLGETVRTLEKYPPKAAKVNVTINVTAKAKGVKTEVSKDGSTFTITAARDIEKSAWSEDIENPFKRVSAKR